LRDRDERTQETAALHFARGQQNLQAKKYELAVAEFEYVLQIAPEYPARRNCSPKHAAE